MRIKCRLHKFVLHNFFVPCITMHEVLECVDHKFIKRPVVTNLHKFVMHIKMSLYGILCYKTVVGFLSLEIKRFFLSVRVRPLFSRHEKMRSFVELSSYHFKTPIPQAPPPPHSTHPLVETVPPQRHLPQLLR